MKHENYSVKCFRPGTNPTYLTLDIVRPAYSYKNELSSRELTISLPNYNLLISPEDAKNIIKPGMTLHNFMPENILSIAYAQIDVSRTEKIPLYCITHNRGVYEYFCDPIPRLTDFRMLLALCTDTVAIARLETIIKYLQDERVAYWEYTRAAEDFYHENTTCRGTRPDQLEAARKKVNAVTKTYCENFAGMDRYKEL